MDAYSQSSVHHRPLSPAMAAGSCWDQQETCQMVNKVANIQASHDHPLRAGRVHSDTDPLSTAPSPMANMVYPICNHPLQLIPAQACIKASRLATPRTRTLVRYITNWWQRQPLSVSTSSCYEIELYTTQTQLINTSEHVFLSCIGLGWISFMIIIMHLMLDILVFISQTRRLQESGLNLVRMSKTTSDLALLVNRTRILPIDVTDFQNLWTFLPKCGTPSL